MSNLPIRNLVVEDYESIISVVDEWWGGRPVRGLVNRLFFEHFSSTSFAIGDPGAIQAFLIGFVSQSYPSVAYIHFVGVDPALRSSGIGRALYEQFFQVVSTLGCSEVHCITSPINTTSIEFHRKMGFSLRSGTGEINGIPVVLNYAGEDQHRVRFLKSV